MDGETRRLIDFDHAEVVRRKVIATPDRPLPLDLVVAGTLPASGVEVGLMPVAHARRPEYWEIQVVGTTRGVSGAEPTPYRVSFPLETVGSRGVVVVGATRAERIEVPADGGGAGECRGWVALRLREPGAAPELYVAGRCVFPRTGYEVGLRRREAGDPTNLLLDRVVTEPPAPTNGGVAPAVVAAVYRESPAPGCDTVTVLPGGDPITVRDVDRIGFLDALMRRTL